jgi:hypothetical protein
VNEVFVLDQMVLLRRLETVLGGKTDNEEKKPTANDQICLFGILLSEDFLDDTTLLLDRKKRRRHELDSTEFSADAVYARLQIAFNNEVLNIEHPLEWETFFETHPEWMDLDPNDSKRIGLMRNGSQMKWMF